MTWDVQVTRGAASIARFRHSTLNGALFAREDLKRMNPRFTPSLTPRGQARRLVLELCDGTRTLDEVERTCSSGTATCLDSWPMLRCS